MTDMLCLHADGPTTIVTLNRPEKRNALSLELLKQLIDCFRQIAHNPSVRCVILAAKGIAFSSGHDLSEMVGKDLNEYRRLFQLDGELMTLMQSIPQPVIAEVQGMATATGCQLAASCDLVVASTKASFATPALRIGLCSTTPMVALTRVIGRKRALQMLLTGQVVDAATAAEWGLVNFVVPAEQLRKQTLQLGAHIAAGSPLTVALGKAAFYTQLELDQHRAYNYATEMMSMNSLAADAQEGFSAFLGKRDARWVGR
jgi:enoyl-CoA hydratase/carnithine racemase